MKMVNLEITGRGRQIRCFHSYFSYLVGARNVDEEIISFSQTSW